MPLEGELRFLGREIRLGVEKADRAAYHADCVSPDFNAVVQRDRRAAWDSTSTTTRAQLWDAWNLGGLTLGRTMFDDAYETLDWLREHGYRIGCVTNRVFGGPRFVEEMQELRLDTYFESTAVSCDLGYMKPHPKIFEHVMTEMKVEPGETAMVGDSLRADVEASQALGMTASGAACASTTRRTRMSRSARDRMATAMWPTSLRRARRRAERSAISGEAKA